MGCGMGVCTYVVLKKRALAYCFVYSNICGCKLWGNAWDAHETVGERDGDARIGLRA